MKIREYRDSDAEEKAEVHRLRTGDYRTFIDIDHNQKHIKALTVRKRDKAYKVWN